MLGALDVLKLARDKISEPSSWVKGTYACDAQGNPVGPKDAGAVCWCALGAVAATGISGPDRWSAENALYDAALLLGYARGVAAVNDELGHSSVLKLYDCAITQEGCL